MAKAPGLVKFSENDDSRFLGPSSGSAVTRFVMEFAKQNTARKTIRDVVPDHQAQEIKRKFHAESAKPTSKIYPLISSVAAPTLPNHQLMEKLMDIYMVKAQYMLPLLHEPTFRREVDLVYNGSNEPTLNFQVRLVIAISMQKLDTQFAGLADSYYLAALPYLTEALQKKDLSTLQCFALIAQYSLLTPTRTAAYWVVDLAAKLCQELGLCDEQTIEKPPSGIPPNRLEIDMRRRLYWIILSMEYGLSHSLGRPSAFGVSVDNIHVRFFEMCDDQYITPNGLLPGHHPIMKKCIAIHFLKMRLLQAEIRRTLYLKKRPAPISDTDPWFQSMLNKIDDWVRNCPKNDEGSGLSEDWFKGRWSTMVIFMYRPSPQIPIPSLHAAEQCYECAVFDIDLQERQVREQLIDVTWIFTQAIFMALNTVLWSLSYPEIRTLHPIEEVTTYIETALRAIDLCADRWPGVLSARQLYGNLIHGCLRAFDNDKSVTSPGSVSMRDYSSPASQPATSPPSANGAPLYNAHSPHSTTQFSTISSNPSSMNALARHSSHNSITLNTQQLFPTSVAPQSDASFSTASPPVLSHHSPYASPNYETHLQQFPFPPNTQSLPSWDSLTSAPASSGNFAFANVSMEDQPWLASYGDVYSQYMGQTFPGQISQHMESLSEQEQLDLMESLERSQLPDLSSMVDNTTTFYTPQFP